MLKIPTLTVVCSFVPSEIAIRDEVFRLAFANHFMAGVSAISTPL